MSIKELVRLILGIIIGAILYIPLTLVPLIGPLISGFAAGSITRGNPWRAFYSGFVSAFLGFLAWVFYIIPYWNLESFTPSWFFWLFWWIFAVWNFLGALLSGTGAVFGAMLSNARTILPRYEETGKNEDVYSSRVNSFTICPGCGSSNPDEKIYCQNCGTKLGEEE